MTALGKVRLGVIGAGWWATANHIPVLAARDDVELVGVARLGRPQLDQLQQQFGFSYATEDYRQLLTEVELDAVVVASPHSVHYEHARAALEAGLHVLVEKPMCLRAAHARELVRLATTNRLHLLVPYGWHYKRFIQDARRRIEQGAIGPVEYVLCHMASPIRRLLSGGGLRPGRRSDPGQTVFPPDPATWSDPQVAGGGYGHSQLAHATGLLFWLTGLAAQLVYALMARANAPVEIYDAISVRFTNGAIGSVSGAGSVPEPQARYQLDLRLFGRDGMLLLDCDRARLAIRRHDGDHYTAPLGPDEGTYSCEGPVHNFVDLVHGRTTTNWAPGEAALRSVELLDAAYRSALSGKPEEVR